MNETWWISDEQLDEDQKAVAGLGPEGSHLIFGPPGSGKTNLLLLRAKYMFLAGHTDILVVVFTKTLQQFIAHGSSAYQLPSNVVTTLRKWQMDFLHEHGVDLPATAKFDDQRKVMAEEILNLISRKKISNVYNALFLDEAQDYLPQEIEIFDKLGKEITAAVDIHQKIYSTQDCMNKIRGIVDKEHPLRFHYRVGHSICKLADRIKKNITDYVPLLPTCNYNEAARPSSVEAVPLCASLEEQVDKILNKLRVQLKAYPDELLAVLCPRNDDLDRIWEIIVDSDLGSLAMKQGGGDHSAYDEGKMIHVGNVHSAKGVEFRAVHLACCESLKDFRRYHRNITYTAITRAKTSLSLYRSGEIWGIFDKRL